MVLRFAIAALVLAPMFAAPHVGAQDYPARAVRIIVPYAAGGTSDVLARIMGQRLGEAWGQPVVVENRAGANGNVGSDQVAKSAPDGYTLLLGTSGSNAVNPSLYRTMPYDAKRDLAYVAPIASTANVLLVNPSSPHQSLKDLLDAAKRNPGKVSYGSSGVGSVLHLCGVLLAQRTGSNLLHIAYKGTGPSLTDLLGGQIDSVFSNLPAVVPQIQSGKMRALAVTSAARDASVPNVPTMQESGIAGYDLSSWFGLFAPAATPREVVRRINAEVSRQLEIPEVRQRLLALGAVPTIKGADEANRFFHEELERWAQVVKASGATAD
ncbi:MAG: tripartite tricarboxylate transporter substrate binding protein [Betaproteobacteria bacterium]|nr:tripartite tricarboxylate transporter substrate binding protein [Betaproteobacteria bacterium]